MFVACGRWCLADVSSVSPSSEQTDWLFNSCVIWAWLHNLVPRLFQEPGYEVASYKLKLYRPLLCSAEIKGKSVTDHQQDT